MPNCTAKPTLRQSVPLCTLDTFESILIQNLKKFTVPARIHQKIPNCMPVGGAVHPGPRPGDGVVDPFPRGQSPISCPLPVVLTGVDTLHISYEFDIQNNGLLHRIQQAKKTLQTTSDLESTFNFLENGSDKFQWNLQRSGSKLYPFIFRTGDLILCLSTRKCGTGIPNAALAVGSLTCNQNVRAMLNTFKFWLSCIDVFAVSEKVSRLDLFSDILHDIKVGRLNKVSQFISDARDTSLFYSNRKFTGVQWGKGSIVCRIYDKQLQMSQSQQHEKQVFFNCRWGTSTDQPVTRVEFQLRREAIVEFFKKENTSVDEVLTKAAELWSYYTKGWLRHCSSYVDRDNKNQSRAQVSPFWRSVQAAFSFTAPLLNRVRTQKHINIPALRAQAKGIYTTIAAGFGIPADPWLLVSQITQIVIEDIFNLCETFGFTEKYQLKLNQAVVSF